MTKKEIQRIREAIDAAANQDITPLTKKWKMSKLGVKAHFWSLIGKQARESRKE